MDFHDLFQIRDGIEQIQKTYELFHEDTRPNRFHICEKPELLGMTNHLLFVGEKEERRL